jgi:hypothetical protein
MNKKGLTPNGRQQKIPGLYNLFLLYGYENSMSQAIISKYENM